MTAATATKIIAFQCAKDDLARALSLVSRAVPSRPAMPILGNIKLEADEEKQIIRLTAFDLALGITTQFSATIEIGGGGAIALPAKLLSDMISRLPAGSISFRIEDLVAAIAAGTGRYTLNAADAAEFPELPTADSQEAIALPADALLKALKGTVFAASTDETKQILQGVHIFADGDRVEFAATDGHRLAVSPIVLEDAEIIPNDFTIPGRALRELERCISDTDTPILFHHGSAYIEILLPGTHLACRLMEGQYPNYRQLIPAQFSREAAIDRRSLIDALTRVEVLASAKNNVVTLAIGSEQIQISATAQDLGSGTEAIACDLKGEPIDIAFNVKYLLESLKAIASSEVLFCANTPKSPVIFRPVGGTETHLLMPIQIRS